MTIAEILIDALRDPAVRAALREALAVDHDEVLTLERAGEIAGVRGRVIRDAGRRGEIAIVHAGRSPRVRRAELDRWIATRESARPTRREDDPRADDRAAYARAVARAGRAA